MSKDRRLEDFTELAEFRFGDTRAPEMPSAKHNVLKRSQVVRKGIEEVGLGEDGPEDPLVSVQREGDHVTSVDFRCICGRSASIRLEYDEE
jgi:hypothetical protein